MRLSCRSGGPVRPVAICHDCNIGGGLTFGVSWQTTCVNTQEDLRLLLLLLLLLWECVLVTARPEQPNNGQSERRRGPVVLLNAAPDGWERVIDRWSDCFLAIWGQEWERLGIFY
jgi:hypothetical protein